MLVCHCQVVSDRHIKLAVSAGARTVAQVGRACKAGTHCGGCVAAIAEIIESHSDSPRCAGAGAAGGFAAVAAE